MKKPKIKLISLIALTALFFSGAAILTFTAKSIHENRLPHVTAGRLTRESFDGGYSRRLALPKELYMDGYVLIMEVRVVNGEKRNFAKSAPVKTEGEIENFYEITSGLFGNELIITAADRPFNPGDEVFTETP